MSPPTLPSLVSVLLLVGLAGPGCAPKVPPPPPEYADDGRVPSGDSKIEYKISETDRLLAITKEERAVMARKLLKGSTDEGLLTDYVGSAIGQGELGDAVDLLHTLAVRNPEDEVAVADALNLAMGRLQWKACAAMAESYLRQRLHRGVFFVRALCLERSGSPVEAKDNFEAALEVLSPGPLSPAISDELLALMGERGGSRPLPPASDDVLSRLLPPIKRAGTIETLFLAHLLNRFEPELKVGRVDWGELSGQEVRTVVGSRARAYRHCYKIADAEARRNNRLAGSSTYSFVIGGMGAIERVEVAESRWIKVGKHPQEDLLNTCMIEQLSRLRFPRPRYSLPVPAQHRVSFQPD